MFGMYSALPLHLWVAMYGAGLGRGQKGLKRFMTTSHLIRKRNGSLRQRRHPPQKQDRTGHPVIDGVKKRAVEVLVYSIILLFAFFVMVIGGIRLVNLTFALNQISPAMQIKVGYVYSVLPLTGILFMYFCLNFIVEALRPARPEPQKEQVHVSALD